MSPTNDSIEPLWVLVFDFRSDDGPQMIGPFDTKEAALAWLDTCNIKTFEAMAAPVTKP